MSQKKHFFHKNDSNIPFLSESLVTKVDIHNKDKTIPCRTINTQPHILYRKIHPIIRKRIKNEEYNSFKPKFKNENLTPNQRKRIHLSESNKNVLNELKMSNSLGFFSRVKNQKNKEKEEQSKINQANSLLLHEQEEIIKNFKNVSKQKKIDFLKSDVFYSVKTSNRKCKVPNKFQTSSYSRTHQSKKNVKTIDENNKESTLSLEIEERFQTNIAKQRKFLNLTSKLDNYSMNTPKNINNLEFHVRTIPNKDKVIIKKIFSSQGLHIFDLVDNSSVWKANENNDYKFKIRVDSESKINLGKIKKIKYKLQMKGYNFGKVH